MKRLALAVAALALAGCVSEQDVRKPLQEHLVVTGRIMGFAYDAQIEALETKLQLLEADPKLQDRLGRPDEVRKKLERIRQEQLSLSTELKALKERYPVEGE